MRVWPEHAHCAGVKPREVFSEGVEDMRGVDITRERMLGGDKIDKGSIERASHKANACEDAPQSIDIDDLIEVMFWQRALNRAPLLKAHAKVRIVAAAKLVLEPSLERDCEPVCIVDDFRAERPGAIPKDREGVICHVG